MNSSHCAKLHKGIKVDWKLAHCQKEGKRGSMNEFTQKRGTHMNAGNLFGL